MKDATESMAGASHFSYWTGVPGEPGIILDQCNAFDRGLRHQETIEWIFMSRRQTVDIDRVFAGDGEFCIAVI